MPDPPRRLVQYTEFVEAILRNAVEATTKYEARLNGTSDKEVLHGLDVDVDPTTPEFWASPLHHALIYALQDLGLWGILRTDGDRIFITDSGREVAVRGLAPLWPSVFNMHLDADEEAFLTALVKLTVGVDGAMIQPTQVERVLGALGWSDDIAKTEVLFKSLAIKTLVAGGLGTGGYIEGLRPTYNGVVRATEYKRTMTSALVQNLLPEWETATVEFKLQVPLDREADKAEFAKDICALATTKASGVERYLVVGFDPKSHFFARSVDSRINQDRIEQILNAHTVSAPVARLEVAPWEHGTIGVIRVLREESKVPYRLTSALAQKFFKGRDVFVRHGSQVEPPTPTELTNLVAEGERASSREK
jgi:hypothetical protein